MAISEVVSIESFPSRPSVAGRVHPLRALIAALVLAALLLEVTASFAARRAHGAPQFRTYTTTPSTATIDPHC
jgi:hypothetical protein